MFGHFALFLLWSLAWLVSADPNKHYLDRADADSIIFGSYFNHDYSESGPVALSPRIRRQLMKGPSSFFIHDTDTADETGPWGPWEGGEMYETCGTKPRTTIGSQAINLVTQTNSRMV